MFIWCLAATMNDMKSVIASKINGHTDFFHAFHRSLLRLKKTNVYQNEKAFFEKENKFKLSHKFAF